jgi:hypothetical protein
VPPEHRVSALHAELLLLHPQPAPYLPLPPAAQETQTCPVPHTGSARRP